MTIIFFPPLVKTLQHWLEEQQAIDIVCIDVREQTVITDYMIICSGRSSRHVKAIAENSMEQMKKEGFRVLNESGLQTAEWVLLDFGEVIAHIMQPATRAFYHLEGLWHAPAS